MALAYSSNHGQGLEQRQPPLVLVKGRNIDKHEKVALILRIKRARFWFRDIFESEMYQ